MVRKSLKFSIIERWFLVKAGFVKCICTQRMNYKSMKTTLYVIIRCPSYYALQAAASDGSSEQYKKIKFVPQSECNS
jgi:hypothetical protein